MNPHQQCFVNVCRFAVSNQLNQLNIKIFQTYILQCNPCHKHRQKEEQREYGTVELFIKANTFNQICDAFWFVFCFLKCAILKYFTLKLQSSQFIPSLFLLQ